MGNMLMGRFHGNPAWDMVLKPSSAFVGICWHFLAFAGVFWH
jgi:hypothetical protein